MSRSFLPLVSAAATIAVIASMTHRLAADGEPAGTDSKASIAPLDGLVSLLADVDDEAVRLDVLRGIDAALRGRRNVGVPRGWPAVRDSLARSENPELCRLATRIALVFGDDEAALALRSIAADRSQPAAERTAAIEVLADAAHPGLLGVLLDSLDDEAVRRPALRALAVYDDRRIPQAILSRYPGLDPATRRDAVATLSSRPAWAIELLEAVGEKAVPSSDLSAYDARHLAELGNADVTRLLGEVWGEVRPTRKEQERLLREYRDQLHSDALADADLSAGRLVYHRTCAGCHRLFDAGRHVGPDLTGSQRFNLDYVLQNLLDPNAIIGRDFRVTILVTDSGRIVSGLVAEEDDNAIVMLTATETLTVPAVEIEVRKESEASMMPEGMLQKLSPNERRDLVAYLAAPAQVPLPEGAETAEGEPR